MFSATTATITIKVVDGDYHSMECNPLRTTVHDVKVFIRDRVGHPVSRQMLIFRGRRLHDGANLSSYEVTKHCMLQLHVLPDRSIRDNASSSMLDPVAAPAPSTAPVATPAQMHALKHHPGSPSRPATATLPAPATEVIDLTVQVRFQCCVCGVNASGVMLQPCLHTCICTCCVMQMGPTPKCPKCLSTVTTFTTVNLHQ
jgi:hypothetical protein